jgi:carbon-monoxide dehydrogenase iron sulfur subunit
VGCWVCATICTYGVVGREKEERIALKCDRCRDLEIPACVNACPTGTLIFLDEGQLADVASRDADLKTAEIQRSRT